LSDAVNKSISAGESQDSLAAAMPEAGVNELFASCLPQLKKAARTMLNNDRDCEDALQDALLLACRKFDQFEGRSSFSTWLHSILRNTSKTHYRNSIARRTISLEAYGAAQESLKQSKEFIDTRPSPEELCIQSERSQILWRPTRRMPAEYLCAVHYFHLGGLGEQETTRRLRMSESALKSQLDRSRRLLISSMRRAYASSSPQPLLHRDVPSELSDGAGVRSGRRRYNPCAATEELNWVSTDETADEWLRVVCTTRSAVPIAAECLAETEDVEILELQGLGNRLAENDTLNCP
jgi:RNA polymerase sigma factor (sigma-70 family)